MIGILLALSAGPSAASHVASAPAQESYSQPAFSQTCTPFRPGQSCTVFFAAEGDLVLGGNNEDFWIPFTKLWFLPAEDGKHGRMYVGFDNYFTQGGMNDQGLFFDGLAVTNVTIPDEGKPVYNGNLIDKAMADCATVACAIDIWNTYNRAGTWNGQLLFGDATGDAAIIEPLDVIRKSDWYLLSTNFYQSTTSPEEADCWRFKTATEMFQQADGLSVDLFRAILDATHQENTAQTLYSNIYDLKQRVMYLYLFHDFEHVVTINLDDELAKGEHVYDIPALFAPNAAFEKWARYQIDPFEKRIESLVDANVDPAIYANYAGQYEVAAALGMPFAYVTVSDDAGRLYIDIPGDHMPRRELYPQSETDFFHTDWMNSDNFEITFVTDGSGRATQIVFSPDGGKTQVPLPRME